MPRGIADAYLNGPRQSQYVSALATKGKMIWWAQIGIGYFKGGLRR
jgi:hypothetical protein